MRDSSASLPGIGWLADALRVQAEGLAGDAAAARDQLATLLPVYQRALGAERSLSYLSPAEFEATTRNENKKVA